MGGWGVSRVRRVGCGAVLLPVSSVAVSSASVIWYAWAARCRLRHVPSALLSSLSAHLFYISSMASARGSAVLKVISVKATPLDTGCSRDKFPWSVDSRARAQ